MKGYLDEMPFMGEQNTVKFWQEHAHELKDMVRLLTKEIETLKAQMGNKETFRAELLKNAPTREEMGR